MRAFGSDTLASAADIGCGMTLGCAHPMGPLALADLNGLDTVRAIGHVAELRRRCMLSC